MCRCGSDAIWACLRGRVSCADACLFWKGFQSSIVVFRVCDLAGGYALFRNILKDGFRDISSLLYS